MTPLCCTDAEAIVGARYTFSVVALNDAGRSGEVGDSGYRLAPAAAPAGVAASDDNADRVEVSWNAVTDAARYEVLRDGGGVIATVTSISYDDASAPLGKHSEYAVRAVNAAGTSPLSATDTGIRPVTAENIEGSTVFFRAGGIE